jgi:release factor glutamine methyltransferase
LLDSADGPFDVISANPPYLSSDEAAGLAAAGWIEPELALDGGPDGLTAYRRLVPQAKERLRPDGHLLLEAAPNQMAELGKMLVQNDYHTIIIYKDLSGRERVLHGRSRP